MKSRRRRRSGRQPPRRADSAFQCVEQERMGGAVGPWRRSGTEVLLEMSDILKRVKDVFVDVGGLEGS